VSTNVFFDTEFTHLWEPLTPEPAVLVSIGCVSEDGKRFYAENANFQHAQCSQFVIESVLPLLNGGVVLMPYPSIANRLKYYVESFNDEVIFWSDCPSVDWCHVSDMFGFFGWPENLNRTPKALFFESAIKQTRFKNGVKNARFAMKLRPHHALDDAIANKAGYLSVMANHF
jgi:hypothetical protein